MINIRIKTVKQGTLPFNRVGDWHWEGRTLVVSVEKRRDWRYEFLVGIHELSEAFLCKASGISEEQIDQFDKEHGGKWIPSGPGYREHLAAEGIERILAAMSGVNWDNYEQEVSGG